MAPSKQQLDDLAKQLPHLQFCIEADSSWPLCEPAQCYLNYYEINFARELTGVVHGFGRVNAGSYRIATHYWIPENPIGTLLIVHGYYDHVGVYDHAIRFALKRQLAVIAFDLPGHGLSSGEPAVIDSFNQYGDVLDEVLRQSEQLLPQPLSALGQSTGAAVILNFLWRYPDQQVLFTKIALCSPLIVARAWRSVGRYVYPMLKYFLQYIARGPAQSSHDTAFNIFLMEQDPLQAKFLSLRWVGAMKKWDQAFCRFAPLSKSVLLVQGTADMTVDAEYNIPLIQKKLPNAHLVHIADAGHQLVNESELYRNQVFAALDHYFLH